MYQNTCTMRKVLKWEESVFLNWLRLRAVGTPPPLWMLIIGFLSLSMPLSSRGPRRAQAHQMLSHQGSESGGADTSFPCKWSPFTRAQLTSSRPSSGDPPCAPTPQILGSLLILAVPLFLSHFSSLPSVVRPSWTGIGDALESSPKTVAD